MQGIKKKYSKKWGLGDNDWEEMAFTIINPTSSDEYVNLFDPQLANTFNYPTTAISTSSLIPSVHTPITTAPFRGISVTYDTVNQKVWAGRHTGAGGIYSYSDNPPQTSPATFTTVLLPAQTAVSAVSFSVTSVRLAVGSSTGFITVVNSSTNAIIADVPMGFVGVNWIEWNSVNNTWVVSTSTNNIVIIDCATATVITSIALGVGVTPERIAINTANNTGYVADSTLGNDQIFKLNLTTNTIITTISTLGFISQPFAVAINPSTTTMYVGSLANLGIWTFNTTTDTFTTNIAPTRKAVDFEIHTPSNSVFGVGLVGTGTLLRFNGTSNTLEDVVTFTQLLDRISLAFSPTQNIIYASSVTVAPFQLNSFVTATTPTLHITGSTNINQAVRDGFYSPYWIRRMYFYSQNTDNFKQTFFVLTKDANGNSCEEPNTPSLSVATLQFQTGIGMVDYPDKKLVLGINQWFKNILVKAGSELTIILVYQQLEKSYLLTYNKNNGQSDEFIRNNIQKFNLKDLNFIMPLNAPLVNQSVKPFDVGEFNNALIEEAKIIEEENNQT